MPISRRDFSGLTDQYMDMAAFNIDPQFQNLFLRDPKEIDQRRLNAYRYFMEFYKGRHWEEAGEFNPAYGGPNFVSEEFSRRTWNHSKNIVDKLVSFLVKEGFNVKIPEQLESEDQAVEHLLETVWEANSKEKFAYNMAYMGAITGDCFIKVWYDENFYADGIGELRFEVLDSRTVIPVFDGEERHKMIGCRIQYPMYEIQEDGSKRKVMFQEIHTDGSIIRLIDGEVTSNTPNPLGEMMVIHIKNEPLPFERFGRSDLDELVVVQKEFNEKISDISEILAYHAAPITIIKGARVQTLEKGARKVWGGIPKDGDVFNLALNADLSSSLQYLEQLRTLIAETGGVPQEALGALQNVSNTSGSALHLQYQPILDRIDQKQIDYGEGLRKINRIILRFYEAVGAIDLPEDLAPPLKYKTSIEWGDALPRDRSIDLSDISTEIGLGVESKRGALKRLGEENPEHKLEEIKEEALDQADLDFMTAGIGGFGDPGVGPEGLGTNAGAEDGPQNDVSGAVNAAKTNPVTQGEQTSVQAVKKSAQTTTGAFANKK